MKLRSLLPRLFPSIGTLRVSLYFTCVTSLFAVLAARSVRADIGEMGLAAGRQLSRLEDLTKDAEVLLVNGARFHHATVYTSQSVSQVLDRFEAECERNPGAFGQALKALPAGALERLAHRPQRGGGNAVVRDESEEGGMLACFVGAKPGSLADFRERIAHFSQTLDLAELGDLRYAYVMRKAEGTRVITLWTDTDLNLSRMFPAQGDAEGTDSALAPRPPSSRRTFTATAADMPFGVRVYESTEAEPSLQAFYEATMKQRGFSVPENARRDGTTAFVKPDGTQVFMSLSSDDGKRFVTLTEASGQVAAVTAEVSE